MRRGLCQQKKLPVDETHGEQEARKDMFNQINLSNIHSKAARKALRTGALQLFWTLLMFN